MAERIITRSWGSRLGDSVKGVLAGILLFGLSFVLLWWNEGEAVRKYKQLNEVRLQAISVSAVAVIPANEGALVHMNGRASTPDVLQDPIFGLPTNAIRMRRNVEMYQWREERREERRDKVGGGQEIRVSFSHRTEWSPSLIDSDDFEEASPERRNPKSMPYQDIDFIADPVNLGSFQLDPQMVRRSLNFWEPLTPRQPDIPEGGRISSRYLYFGAGPGQPAVGDVRVSFDIVPESEITVIARQTENRLVSWTDSTGKSNYWLRRGLIDLDGMLAMAKQDIRMMSWILRGAGWLLMTIGLNLILKPIVMLGMVLPFLGRLIGGGLGIAAGLLSAVLTLITIGIAWVAVRPVIGIPVLIAAAVLLFLQFKRSRKAPESALQH